MKRLKRDLAIRLRLTKHHVVLMLISQHCAHLLKRARQLSCKAALSKSCPVCDQNSHSRLAINYPLPTLSGLFSINSHVHSSSKFKTASCQFSIPCRTSFSSSVEREI